MRIALINLYDDVEYIAIYNGRYVVETVEGYYLTYNKDLATNFTDKKHARETCPKARVYKITKNIVEV